MPNTHMTKSEALREIKRLKAFVASTPAEPKRTDIFTPEEAKALVQAREAAQCLRQEFPARDGWTGTLTDLSHP